MPRRTRCDYSTEDWSQEIIIGREGGSNGTLYKAKEGRGVKIVDKMS